MPASAILAVALLCLSSLGCFAFGAFLVLFEAFPGATILLAACGFLDFTLAMGIARRSYWARRASIVWSGFLIVAALFLSVALADTNAAVGPLIPWIPIVLVIALTREKARIWCGDLRQGRSDSVHGRPRSGFLSIDHPAEEEEVLTYDDEVELIEHLDEYGLRAGAVGTVVDLREDPASFDVQFIDDRTETTTLVTLRPGQLRFLPEPR